GSWSSCRSDPRMMQAGMASWVLLPCFQAGFPQMGDVPDAGHDRQFNPVAVTTNLHSGSANFFANDRLKLVSQRRPSKDFQKPPQGGFFFFVASAGLSDPL